MVFLCIYECIVVNKVWPLHFGMGIFFSISFFCVDTFSFQKCHGVKRTLLTHKLIDSIIATHLFSPLYHIIERYIEHVPLNVMKLCNLRDN